MRDLDDFLLSAFSASELRRFLRYLPDGGSLVRRLPERSSLVELVDATTRLLERERRIDLAFFDELVRARPRREAEIRAVQNRFLADAAGPTPSSGGSSTPPPRAGEGYDVFLSHASPDKNWVGTLYDLLLGLGVRPYLDARDLLPGDDWNQEIPRALAASRVCVVVVSPNLGGAHYAQAEITEAISLKRERGTRIVPVLLGGARPPPWLGNIHGIDADRVGIDAVARAIADLPELRGEGR